MKKPSDSRTIMTQLVQPNDTNGLGNLHGGEILKWMDVASAIAAGKHSNAVVVTVSVDNVVFQNPVKLGDVVTIEATVTRVFNTSIEVFLKVWAENLPSETRYTCNEAYYTFVALDSNGKPRKTYPIEPESEEEKKQFAGAMRRRELRLMLAGRMKLSDTVELKTLFS